MEVRAYLRFFVRKWKSILLIFLVTFAATAFLTFKADPVYRATTTFIVSLSVVSEDDRTTISAIDTLSNRVEIATTYAKVAKSRLIQDLAVKELGLSSSQASGLTVSTQILAGTNILEIAVEGRDPAVVRDYADTLGRQSVLYGQKLYEIYALEILDVAQLPKKPIKPNIPTNLVLGGVFGLILGFAFALFMEYLNTPAYSRVSFNILDENTGTYNMRFLNLRLHQEINRARRNDGVLSIALINIDHQRLLDASPAQARVDATRNVVAMFSKNLRDEDVMAPFSNSEIALFLPDLDGNAAKRVVERLLESVSMISVGLGDGDQMTSLHGAAGIAPFYGGDTASVDELVSRAQNALDSMRESTYGRVMISTEGAIEGLHQAKKKQTEMTRR